MSEQIVESLESVQEQLVALAELVESMLQDAVDQLLRCELDGLERLSEHERQIHHQRLQIEMACLQHITTQRPSEAELRLAVAMAEIAADLERVGEHAQSIARTNSLTVDPHLRQGLTTIQQLTAEVQAMLNSALDAFVARDLATTQALWEHAGRVNLLHQGVFQELLETMNYRPRVANQAIFLSRAAYSLKRASERLLGTADWISFAVKGNMPRDKENPLVHAPTILPDRIETLVI
jgi:phosphate transport system protein